MEPIPIYLDKHFKPTNNEGVLGYWLPDREFFALQCKAAKSDVIGGEFCLENRKHGRNPCGSCSICFNELKIKYDQLKQISGEGLV